MQLVSYSGINKRPYGNPCRKRINTGFTLIEMLVVIVIITTIGMGVIPTFLRNTDRYRMKDTVRHVSDMMYFCRSMAVIEGTTFRLMFDREKGECRIYYVNNSLDEPGTFQPYKSSGLTRYVFPRDVKLESLSFNEQQTEDIESEQIDFYMDGSAIDTQLVFANKRVGKTTIRVSGTTALIKIREGKEGEIEGEDMIENKQDSENVFSDDMDKLTG